MGIGTKDKRNIKIATNESNFPLRSNGVTSFSGGGWRMPTRMMIIAKKIHVGNQMLSASIINRAAHATYFCFFPINA